MMQAGNRSGLTRSVLIGVACALCIGLLQYWLGRWIGYEHAIFQFPAILLAVWLGRSSAAGISALGVTLTLWLAGFHPLADPSKMIQLNEWAELFAYTTTGLWVTFWMSGKIAEASQRSAELDRLRYAIQAAKVGIWEWDIIHDRILWNDRMYELYGLDPDKTRVDYQVWEQGVHPEDRARAASEIAAAVAGRGDLDTQFQVLRPDGSVKTIRASAMVRRDDLGKPVAMYGLNRDVSDELRVQRELQEMNTYFEASMMQSQVGVVIVEAPSGKI